MNHTFKFKISLMTFYTLFRLVFTIGIMMEFTSVPFLLTVTCISVGICASNPSQGRYMKSVKVCKMFVDVTNSYTCTIQTLFI